MNITKTGLAIALAAAFTSSAFAANNDSGLITFDGAVSAHSCQLTTNNGVDASNVSISMPVVQAADVQATSIAKGGVGEKEFELNLSNCDPAIKSASISFSSPQFVELTTGTLKNDPTQPGSAKNVNIALFNNVTNGTPVRVGLPDDAPQKVTLSGNKGAFAYIASYVPSNDMDATNNPVVPGTVSTNATFTISYQ